MTEFEAASAQYTRSIESDRVFADQLVCVHELIQVCCAFPAGVAETIAENGLKPFHSKVANY
jgi:hypothetical protein